MVLYVQHPKSMGTGKSARALVFFSAAKNLGRRVDYRSANKGEKPEHPTLTAGGAEGPF